MEYKIFFLVWLWAVVDGAIYDLYNTKIATSDLKWTAEPRLSWEEVSGFDKYGAVIRSYQVCRIGVKENNNWLRSPFIRTMGAHRVNVEVEFSIAKCDWPGMDDDYCRQTFNLFYYESQQDVASSTFPPWQERPYIKVDTVAANSQNEINKKTFTISNLKRAGGIYIAAQDQGACMSLISLRVYYYYCPETTHSLAVFENTMVGERTASLVTVPGSCVANAEYSSRSIPKYYCGSTGQWQIITGNCQCVAGYEPNLSLTACQACPKGTFKLDSGNKKCITCPTNSGPTGDKMVDMEESWKGFASVVKSGSSGLKTCLCHPGYYRAKGEATDASCTKPPSSPLPGTVTTNSTDAIISWATPLDLGGRDDQYYSVICKICDPEDMDSCEKCPTTVSFFVLVKEGSDEMREVQTVSKLYKNEVTIGNLEPFTMYTIEIFSHNAVSDSSNEQAAFLRVDALTKESVPSPVTDIYIADHSMNSVVIKWQVPETPRGVILGYELEIRQRFAISRATRASIRTSDTTTQSAATKSIIKETTRTTMTLESLEADTEYLVRIRAKTGVGYGSYSSSVMFRTSKRGSVKIGKTETEDGTGFLIAAVSCVLLLAVGCSGLVFYYSRKKRSTMEQAKKSESSNGPRSSRYDEVKDNKTSVKRRSHNSDTMEKAQKIYVDYPDPGSAVQDMNKEIDPSLLRLENVIGEGEFALAYRAMMLSRAGEMIEVAAKQLKDGASVKDQANFLKEACTMAQFNHPNIVQLKGVITKHKPVMIISEYMENGSLEQFLRERRGQFTIPELLDMLRNIANGMRYLSRMQYVHRDLAARNILVSHDYVCKVSDFGLSRTLENDPHATYTTQGGKIALRWTAPECIRYRQFTSASDVWSFGIVMWEVMSYGEKPYWDMTNHEVVQSIGSGMRLPAPVNCPKALHELMLECWSIDPKKRPTFSKIVSDLNRLLRHSALLVNSEDQAEQSVINSTDIDQRTYAVREDSFDSRISNDDMESDSSMSDEEDTCSSSLNVDERCLKV